MRKPRLPARSAAAIGLAAALALLPARPVLAQDRTADARGLVEITQAVGTGVAFDVLTDTLSSVFLSAQPGDAVTLVLYRRHRDGTQAGAQVAGEVLILSSGTYGADLGPATLPSGIPAADNTGGARRLPIRSGGLPGNILFLAQFN